MPTSASCRESEHRAHLNKTTHKTSGGSSINSANKTMKNHFVSYDKTDFNGDNNQNILFEMMALCISDGTRIIIEQNAKRGSRYLMVDFQPTDESNGETTCDGAHVCFVSSVNNDDEGEVSKEFTNYIEAALWLSVFIRQGDFQEIYIETY